MVITISRQFGSGGRELGRLLADALNIPFYDKEIIKEVAAAENWSTDFVDKHTEQNIVKTGPIIAGRSFSLDYQESVSDRVFKKQTNIISQIAAKGDAVFVGRCSDYICKGSLDIMVYAEMNARIARCMEREVQGKTMTTEEMRKRIIHIDKQRGKYYEYYTGQKWSDMKNYDLCINTTELDMDKALAVALALVR